MSQQQKSYLLPIVMMFALFAMISFVTGLPAPFGVIVQSEFGATNLEATLGFAANFIAYAFMGIPSGLLLQKIGYKKTALWAMAVGVVGLAVQYLSSVVGTDTVLFTMDSTIEKEGVLQTVAFPVTFNYFIYLLGAFISGYPFLYSFFCSERSRHPGRDCQRGSTGGREPAES